MIWDSFHEEMYVVLATTSHLRLIEAHYSNIIYIIHKSNLPLIMALEKIGKPIKGNQHLKMKVVMTMRKEWTARVVGFRLILPKEWKSRAVYKKKTKEPFTFSPLLSKRLEKRMLLSVIIPNRPPPPPLAPWG